MSTLLSLWGEAPLREPYNMVRTSESDTKGVTS
jgi:hypothetical protein